MPQLAELHAGIAARVEAIRQGRPDWPCARGCDRCCRQLADLPRLTRVEWLLLKEGLAALSPERREEIRQAVATLGGKPPRPVTCPLLEQTTGACPVYLQRPVACRTYGFYLQRGLGLYCGDIKARVAAGTWADVVWGNQDAVDRLLAGQGENRSLAEWFADEDMAGGKA
ncbi:MAG: YkgJ family cysteine cluster protein [Rhodocyclaceae bacterium]|nr:YkgJ family cysteine cluster protein [Rhodocyclaceae bacterium]